MEKETEEPVAPAEEPVAGESAPAEDVAPVEETPTAEGVAEDAAAGEEIVEEPVEKAEEAVGAVDVTSTGTITVDSNIKFTSNETATVSGLTFAGTFEGTAVSKNGIFTVTIKKGLATVKSEGALYVIDGVNPGKLSVYGEVKPENWTSTTDLQDRTSEEHRSGS